MQPLSQMAISSVLSSHSALNLARTSISSKLNPESFYGSKAVALFCKTEAFFKTAFMATAELIYSVVATAFWAVTALFTMGHPQVLKRLYSQIGIAAMSFFTQVIGVTGIFSKDYAEKMTLYALSAPLLFAFHKDPKVKKDLGKEIAAFLQNAYTLVPETNKAKIGIDKFQSFVNDIMQNPPENFDEISLRFKMHFIESHISKID